MRRLFRRGGGVSDGGGGEGGDFGAEQARAALEIQIHPADIRRRVRYLFLTRRDLVLITLALGLTLLFLGSGIALAPTVLRSYLQRREYQALKAEQAQQGRRLQALVERLEELYPRGKDLRLETQKLYLAYGLPDDESSGQGGFPTIVPPVPESEFRDNIERGQTLIAETEQELHVVSVFTLEIDAFQKDFSAQVRTTPSTLPLAVDSFVLTSPFGERTNPFTQARESHAGLDLAAQQGTPIYATADGRVVFAGRYPRLQSVGWWRYGNLVVIRNNDNFVTLFGHCHEVLVKQNQAVKRGDLIAVVGSTGWSSNPHLHYEVRRRNEEGNFVPVDPRIYILDYRWDDQERLLIRARRSPMPEGYEPLPQLFAR